MKKVFALCMMLAGFASFAVAQPHLAPWLPPGVEPGIPDFSHCDQPSCSVACEDGDEEGEFCPDLEDDTNGGCFCNPPGFTPIECDQTICGTLYSRFFIRDTDWYQIEVTETDSLFICVNAEIPVLVALVRPGSGENPCIDFEIVSWDSSDCPCEEVCVSPDGTLDPGPYWIVVVPALFNCAQACADYTIHVSCEGDEQLPNEWDMGDLHECYPTETLNPAHRITGIAWLGATVDSEETPDTLDQDEGDDGVTLLDQPWLPCSEVSVQVEVTAGENYQAFVDSGGVLYLNAWKDGNLDCDFCDDLCVDDTTGGASEWIIQNALVEPGSHTFSFIDPGVFDLGRYEGRLRFRLSALPMSGCPPQATDDVGEVEDYIIEDLQLAVNLMGNLTALAGDGSVTLSWSTASERNNDRFEILRDGGLCGTRPGAGTSASRHDYSYAEAGLQNGRTYTYKLVAVDVNGVREELATVQATPDVGASGSVTDYALHQNYPNPFNPSTAISFDLLEDGFVTLTVYNLVGQEVATLVNGALNKGRHAVSFDASALPSGTYLYKLTAGSFTATHKMLLMK